MVMMMMYSFVLVVLVVCAEGWTYVCMCKICMYVSGMGTADTYVHMRTYVHASQLGLGYVCTYIIYIYMISYVRTGIRLEKGID